MGEDTKFGAAQAGAVDNARVHQSIQDDHIPPAQNPPPSKHHQGTPPAAGV